MLKDGTLFVCTAVALVVAGLLFFPLVAWLVFGWVVSMMIVLLEVGWFWFLFTVGSVGDSGGPSCGVCDGSVKLSD
ncbi:hypothetical protein [Poriferisphaera sp. WC338]|uniref:hypothetical protein n=1 Tax=Poriferisphaera sp. WC338 TaxID=3425129 RepID=UPI003D81B57E